MVSKEDKWIRIFDITDVNKHKKGFTIYKVISMLYPESCPDAITKITVWKRYNDFKKLHREIKSLHKTLKIKDKFPSLANSTFFRRFDEEIIEERRKLILNFLEYVSRYSKLFTSNEFVKFFETSHTPSTMLSSTINSIRAELNLPSEPEYLSFHSPESDDECTISDTDSVSTMSSLSPSVQTNEILCDPLMKSSTSLSRLSRKQQVSESLSKADLSVDGFQILDYPTPPQTPSSRSGSSEYIVEAGKYLTMATQYETDRNYGEAFINYKLGIDVLLRNVKDDKDIERRQLVRFKTEKYLLRAEKIYNLYLSPDIKIIQEICEQKEDVIVQRPIDELYKFKVIKVIHSGMMVLHSESQEIFYVKVVHKTCNFNNEEMILPTNVPFMVKLHNVYNCENAIFLVLEFCSAPKLWDYVQQRSYRASRQSAKHFSENRTETNGSDNESECSYSELFTEFNSNKDFLKLELQDCPEILKRDEEKPEEVAEILSKSHELLTSVDAALRKSTEMKRLELELKTEEDFEVVEVCGPRKLSDDSAAGECDVDEFHDISVQNVVKWSAQLIVALESLHKAGIICCDLESKNLLINEKEDLVLTYMYRVSDKKVYNYRNNLVLAPEVYRFENVTSAADWWSFGTILYEMLVGMPISFTHPEGILSYTMLRIPKFVSAEGKSLIKQLLSYDPALRIGSGPNGAEEIKSHPFYRSVKWHQIVPE